MTDPVESPAPISPSGAVEALIIRMATDLSCGGTPNAGEVSGLVSLLEIHRPLALESRVEALTMEIGALKEKVSRMQAGMAGAPQMEELRAGRRMG